MDSLTFLVLQSRSDWFKDLDNLLNVEGDEILIDIFSPEENVLEIKPYGLDLNIFGTYFISTEIMNKRETYTSKDGKYGIWYNIDYHQWYLSHKEDMGGEKDPLMFLESNGKGGFADIARKSKMWYYITIFENDVPVLVETSCSSKNGKSLTLDHLIKICL